jgi:hypothetical protein
MTDLISMLTFLAADGTDDAVESRRGAATLT